MDFDQYQKLARSTAVDPDLGNNYVYPVLGLGGEAGEIQEKIKKVIRDKNGIIDDGTRKAIELELGDLLWYLSNLASELKLSLADIARSNIAKLVSRTERDKIHGEGDER